MDNFLVLLHTGLGTPESLCPPLCNTFCAAFFSLKVLHSCTEHSLFPPTCWGWEMMLRAEIRTICRKGCCCPSPRCCRPALGVDWQCKNFSVLRAPMVLVSMYQGKQPLFSICRLDAACPSPSLPPLGSFNPSLKVTFEPKC